MTLTETDGVVDREVKVGAVDDHPVILSGLRAELHMVDPCQRIVRVAATVDDLLAGRDRSRRGAARPSAGRRVDARRQHPSDL